MQAALAGWIQSLEGGHVANQTIQEEPMQSMGIGSFYIDELVTTGAGRDSSKAMIAIVEWDTFEQMARGHMSEKGRFAFEVPEEMQSNGFLTISWSDDGAISLVTLLLKESSNLFFDYKESWARFS